MQPPYQDTAAALPPEAAATPDTPLAVTCMRLRGMASRQDRTRGTMVRAAALAPARIL